MLFDAGEAVLLTEHGVETGNGREKGNLILTNKRIVLETTRESRRMVFVKDKHDIILINIPLSSVLVADRKKDIIFKGHEFRINADGTQYSFRVKEPQLWINQIASAKSGNLTYNQTGRQHYFKISEIYKNSILECQLFVKRRYPLFLSLIFA